MAKRIVLIICLILSWSFAQAESDRIAVVKSEGMLPYEDVIAGFKQKMPGASVISFTAHGPARLREQITGAKPHIILCLGSKALENASEIREIPKIGLLITSSAAEAYARRSDISGIVIDLPISTQFKIIRQAFPRSNRIGVLYNPDTNQKTIENAEKHARGYHFQLVKRPVRSIKEIPTALHALSSEADILWSVYDQTVYGPESAKYILLYALRKNIPFIGFSAQFACAGAVLGLYGNYEDMGRQAALLAQKILNRETIADRWIEPRSARVAVNGKAAGALGIILPDGIMKMAEKVY